MKKTSNKSILIIENDERILNALQKKLKEFGFIVISSMDGFEGYERAKQEMPDLVIVDDRLPVMSGLKVCRLLKYDERYKMIKIIAMGSKDAMREVEKEDYGFDDLITKPFRFGDFRTMVERVLEEDANA
ncbi:MAG: two-component system response regulator [Candidatus Neomarinimicrobiota bacterium]